MEFYGGTLGLELAHVLPERRVAFYWIGGHGTSMLGIWEVGSAPQKMSLHIALRATVDEMLEAPAQFRAKGITPLDFDRRPTEEPVVLAWMPAASLYFYDPDGNLLELLAMLPDAPDAGAGVVSWTDWKRRRIQL